jgi:hypothetical protein
VYVRYSFPFIVSPSFPVRFPYFSSQMNIGEEKDEDDNNAGVYVDPGFILSLERACRTADVTPFQLPFDTPPPVHSVAYEDDVDLLALDEEEKKRDPKKDQDFVVNHEDPRIVNLDKRFKRKLGRVAGIKVAWLRSSAVLEDLNAAKPLLPELTKVHLNRPSAARTLAALSQKPKIVQKAEKVSNFESIPSYIMEVCHDIQYFNLHDASYAGEEARQEYHKNIRLAVGQYLRWLLLSNLLSVEDLGAPFKILAAITADRHDQYMQYRQDLGYKNLFTSGYQLANFMRYVSLAVASKYEHYTILCTSFTVNTILCTFPFMFFILPAETNVNVVKRLKAVFGANKTVEEISSQIEKQGHRISLNSNAMKRVQVPCFRFPSYVHIPSCHSL